MGFSALFFVGLTENTCDLVDFRHVTAMADYALALFSKIEEVNTHSFNNFRMRIGIKMSMFMPFKVIVFDASICLQVLILDQWWRG